MPDPEPGPEDLQALAEPARPFDPETDHDPLDDVDPRLTSQLGELGDQFGQLGVLLVAASMWPQAFSALTDRLARAVVDPHPSPRRG